MPDCDLCRLERKTRWYAQVLDADGKPIITLLDCATCKVPMAVWGQHGPLQGRQLDIFEALATALCVLLFEERFRGFRTEPRRVPEHVHYHVELVERESDPDAEPEPEGREARR